MAAGGLEGLGNLIGKFEPDSDRLERGRGEIERFRAE
jgi:hypothetical protein